MQHHVWVHLESWKLDYPTLPTKRPKLVCRTEQGQGHSCSFTEQPVRASSGGGTLQQTAQPWGEARGTVHEERGIRQSQPNQP